MSEKVKAIPEGYHSVTPYLIVDSGMKAIEFYKKVFHAKEQFCMPGEQGIVRHAELLIGDSMIMLADECQEKNARGPREYGGSPITIHLYVEDVDAVMQRAIDAGGKLVRPIETMFYGDRSGGIEDPFGHSWYVSTHVEDVSPEEIQKRMAAMSEK